MISTTALSSLPSAYDVFWGLAQPDLATRSPSALRAFVMLHMHAQLRGGLRLSEVGLIGDPLAQAIASEALASKLLQAAAAAGVRSSGTAQHNVAATIVGGLTGVLTAEMLRRAGLLDVSIAPAEMTQDWLAATYAGMLARRATANAPAGASRELAQAISADALRARSVIGADRFAAYRNRAATQLITGASAAQNSPQAIAAARAGMDALLGAPYDDVARNYNGPAVLDRANRSAHYIDELLRAGRTSLVNAAADDQQRLLGELPITKQIAAELRQSGLLAPLIDGRVALGVRCHVLPSLAQLLQGVACHVSGKGVSSAPVTAGGLQRDAFTVDAGYGDSISTPDEHVARLSVMMDTWCAEAAVTGRPMLILGDGPDAAQAAMRSAQRAACRVGYVEVTKGGLNVIGAAPPMDVTTLADTPLKARFESDVIGQWLIRHVDATLARLGLPLLAQRSALTVGYGSSIGPGVMRALRTNGHPLHVATDVNVAAVQQAVGDGFKAVWRSAEQTLPSAGAYFSCVGRAGALNLPLLASLPNGAVVVNCASKGEIDRALLVQLQRGAVPGVTARILDPEQLPEHRTLVLRFADGHEVVVLNMGEPCFDGVFDKERRMVDVLMAGLLCCLAVQATRLVSGAPLGVRSLDQYWQERVSALASVTYSA